MPEASVKLVTPWSVVAVDAPRSCGERPDTRMSRWSGRTSPTPWPAAYGGDLTVGMLASAVQTAGEGQHPHSLQLTFLRPGDRDRKVEYNVENVRDGFRYANRAVRLLQAGRVIAHGVISLRAPGINERALSDIRDLFPDEELPAPLSLLSAADAIAERHVESALDPATDELDSYWATDRALDTRHLDPPLYGDTVTPRTTNRLWVRFTGNNPEHFAMLDTHHGRQALIAYLADDTILEPALATLGLGWRTPGLFSTTVQQNIWFHHDFDASQWLYFTQRLVAITGDHVVCKGSLFTTQGTLVATVIQEGLVKVR